MSEERLLAAPRGKLRGAATIKDFLTVRQASVRQLEQFKSAAPEREKGGNA
jgi:hypothetical protein